MLRDALARRPEDRFTLYALALELIKAGGLEEGEALLREVVRLHPHAGAAWLQLARLLVRRQGEAAGAVALRDGLRALAGVEGADAARARAELEAELAGLGED